MPAIRSDSSKRIEILLTKSNFLNPARNDPKADILRLVYNWRETADGVKKL